MGWRLKNLVTILEGSRGFPEAELVVLGLKRRTSTVDSDGSGRAVFRDDRCVPTGVAVCTMRLIRPCPVPSGNRTVALSAESLA